MTTITRTSPLNLGEVRRTQRRVAALLNASDSLDCFGRKQSKFPENFCYVCSQLGNRGRRFGTHNPYRHLFSTGLLRPCPHMPPGPHPTFVSDDDDNNDEDDDDGFDESWLDVEGESENDGGMFDTSVIRNDVERDPSKAEQQTFKQSSRSQNGRLVPVVSENTFLSTNKRDRGQVNDLNDPSNSDGLSLPQLSNQRTSMIVGGSVQGKKNRKQKDPRRLNSERIDRRETMAVRERISRSDSAVGLELGRSTSNMNLSREKTDPPPLPIVVSIKNQDGDLLQKIAVENLPPGGAFPSEAFAEGKDTTTPRRRRRRKRRPKSRNTDSASPTFSGSMSISRETTLSGPDDSPDYFLSRLRSASWCDCPDHVVGETRCPECRRVKDHEKWCVSRSSVCPNCGKAFKRKYSLLERKSSFGTIPASSMITISSGSPSRNRHSNCSPSKLVSASRPVQHLSRETSSNRVRFEEEDGTVVFPQWQTFSDSCMEEKLDDNGDDAMNSLTKETGEASKEMTKSGLKTYLPSTIDPNIHQQAYNLALADARLKEMFSKKKKTTTTRLQHPKGVYFSYFPLLKRRLPQISSEIVIPPTLPQQAIGLRADIREGKELKVKKGLKHILGSVKMEDYYPGGKSYPKKPSKEKSNNDEMI